MRMSILALACATLLLAACSSGGADTPADADVDATSVPTAAATEADGGDTADVETPDPGDEGGDDSSVLRYIGNTGGSGVAVRDACAQDARTGVAWPDATEVLVLEVGASGCDGWSLVQRDGTSLESWVRNTYLVTTAPVTTVSRPPSNTSTPRPTTTSTPSGTQPPTPAPTQPPTPVTYPQISISPNPLNFGEIPPKQVSARSVLLTNTSTEAVKITSVVFENGTHLSAPFEVTDNCDGQIVNANTACRIVVRFTPLTGGQQSATILISTSSASAPLTALVIGTGFVAD